MVYRQLPARKIVPRLGLGFGLVFLASVSFFGVELSSEAITLEP